MEANLLKLPSVYGEEIMLNENSIEAVIPSRQCNSDRPCIVIKSTTGKEYLIDMTYNEFDRYRQGGI